MIPLTGEHGSRLVPSPDSPGQLQVVDNSPESNLVNPNSAAAQAQLQGLAELQASTPQQLLGQAAGLISGAPAAVGGAVGGAAAAAGQLAGAAGQAAGGAAATVAGLPALIIGQILAAVAAGVGFAADQVMTTIGHGLANAIAVPVEDVDVFLRRQTLALFVAAAVLAVFLL